MNTATNSATHPIAIAAARLGSKADASPDFTNDVEAIILAGETVKLSPLTLWQHIKGIFSAEELAEFPRPGSEPVEGSNAPTDIYYDGVTGTGKPKKQSFYKAFTRSLSFGAMIAQRREHLSAAKANSVDAPEAMRLMSAGRLDSEIRKWDQRDTALNSKVRKAMELHFQFERIKELDKVICRFVTATVENPDQPGTTMEVMADTIAPIEILDKANTSQARAFTPDQFLALDLDKAEKGGGTYSALILSGSRGTKAKQETKVAAATITDIETFKSAINDMASFVYEDFDAGTMSKDYAKLLKQIENDDETLVLVHKLGDMLDELCTKTQARYIKVTQAAKEKANAA